MALITKATSTSSTVCVKCAREIQSSNRNRSSEKKQLFRSAVLVDAKKKSFRPNTQRRFACEWLPLNSGFATAIKQLCNTLVVANGKQAFLLEPPALA